MVRSVEHEAGQGWGEDGGIEKNDCPATNPDGRQNGMLSRSEKRTGGYLLEEMLV